MRSLTCAAVLGGCGRDHVYLRPASDELLISREAPPAVVRRVPAAAATGGLELTISSRGAFERKVGKEKLTSVDVRVVAENRGDEPAELAADESYAIDRKGRRLRPSSVTAPGRQEGRPIAVGPGERKVAEIAFEIPGEDDPDEVAPVHFFTSAAYGGTRETVDVLFVEIPRVYPAPAYYYPPVYPSPWYYPYDGGWYGYGGRWGYGIGFGWGYPYPYPYPYWGWGWYRPYGWYGGARYRRGRPHRR
jgi:hypothetical protein